MLFSRRLRARTTFVPLLFTAFTLVAVAGCSPPRLPLIAVYASPDGEVRALLRACPNSTISSFRMSRFDEDESGTASPRGLDYWSGEPRERLRGEQDISLESLPPSWHGHRQGTEELTAGADYYLTFVAVHDRYDGIGDFRTTDIQKLGRGEVWADGKAMSLKEFRDMADGSC